VIRRARLFSVVLALAAGAIGIISSTQTWLTVLLNDGAQEELLVPGATALPLLAPLSLAVLALAAALTMVGTVLRYAFGVLSLVLAGTLIWLTAQVAFEPGTPHVAGTVTEATGITGDKGVSRLIGSITVTPWPALTLAAWVLLLAASILILATAHRWTRTGRRYDTADTPGRAATGPAGSRPHDAIDDWDDLSRGDDPTA